MKTKKSANNVATLATLLPFTLIQGTTGSGKVCYGLMTDKELSIENFKALMSDIRLIDGGYGFMKFYPEHKTEKGRSRFISVTGVDAQMFIDLANQYQWNEPTPKVAKVTKASKGAKIIASVTAPIAATKQPVTQAELNEVKGMMTAFLAKLG